MAADVEDYTCPLCLCILIEPVTIPCKGKHVLCKECFHKNVDEASLTCPFCRFRIGSWTRRNTKTRSLVDQAKWEFIKKNFPEQVKSHLEGVDVVPIELTHAPKVIAEPGELRKEYEEEMEKVRQEREVEADRNERESTTLIHQLQANEEAEQDERRSRLEDISRLDEEMARTLSDSMVEGSVSTSDPLDRHSAPCLSRKGGKENKVSSSSLCQGPLDVYLVEYTPKRFAKVMRTNSNLDRRPLSTESSNSLDSEVNRHFRPIKAAPRTPPKVLPDGRAVEPVLVRSTPRKLSFSMSESQLESLVSPSSYTISSTPSTSDSPFHAFRQNNSKEAGECSTSGSLFTKQRDAKDAIRKHLKRKEPDDPQLPSTSKKILRSVRVGRCTETLHSDDEVDVLSDELLREQKAIERRLEQERADKEMALKLQQELDEQARTINRSKGSEGEYQLRKLDKNNKNKRKAPSRGRQQTLREVLVNKSLSS